MAVTDLIVRGALAPGVSEPTNAELEGYRLLSTDDVGKTFGTDLELGVIAIESEYLQDYSTGDEMTTKVMILLTSGVGEEIYFEFGENYGDNAPPLISPHVLIKKNSTVVYQNSTDNEITQDIIITMTDGEVITEVFDYISSGEHYGENAEIVFYVKDIEVIEGYEVTFVTNGGTSVTKLEDVEELPTPLPTTTKANHVFAGWYYDNLFTQKANAGDELTTNVTLYAKWYTPTTWCEDIANAIREKDGTTEPIKHLDFPERILAIDSGIDVSDANAVVGDVLINKTFYATSGGKKTGTMADNGTVNTDITTKAQEVTIAGGKHSGSGKVKISSTEQAKIVADNIKSGVSILGQAGGLTPAKAEETKTVTPNFSSGNVVVTPTSGKVMTQVTVNKDSNLIAGNIKKDITVHGITGSSFIAIELTQAQYDALAVYDNNTYYLIVEE